VLPPYVRSMSKSAIRSGDAHVNRIERMAGESAEPAIAAGREHCAAMVRTMDPDRHVATLFAPPDRRPALVALYAFAQEIARVREQVSDPLPGEVRLQWWSDLLDGELRGDVGGHPVAAALLQTIADNRLPKEPMLALIEARSFDLYEDLFPDVTALEGYCGETSSALIQLACIILAKGETAGPAEAAGHAGCAHAITGLLRAFPWTSRRGQCFIPKTTLDAAGADRGMVVNGKDTAELRGALQALRGTARHHLARTRALIGTVEPRFAPAFLHLASTERHLDRMEQPDYLPFETVVDVPHWRRIWLTFRQARRAGL
jgi:15-cis-phytoene synthase